uniref:NUMB domain-containing protein n=1 Tax=Dendroctonus ponderosae TaxID=77166 RepID=A0AAR5QJ46_DENPD
MLSVLKYRVFASQKVSPADSVTALCQQLSQGLSQLTHSGSDDFNFNNTTSLNQNTVNLNLTSINNTFNQSITATPTANVASIAPVTLSFSPNFNRSVAVNTSSIVQTNSIVSSPLNTAIRSSSRNSSAVAALPNPDQWLGKVVKSTSPVPGRMDGSSPRRTPALGPHARAISLDSGAETFKAKPADPFDAEWAETAARQGSSSTNPFLNHTPTPPSSFQIQL